MIAKPQGAPFASWVTGWFNLLGQVAVTTGIRYVLCFTNIRYIPDGSPSSSSFACANFISTAATIGTNYEPNSRKTIGIYAAVLIAQGIVNQSSFMSLSPHQPRRRHDQHLWRAHSQVSEHRVRMVACRWHYFSRHRHPCSRPEAPERQVRLPNIYRRYRR